jgi:DNA repair protein RadC
MSKAFESDTYRDPTLRESITALPSETLGGGETFIIENSEEEALLSSVLGGRDARTLARKIRARYPDLVKLRRASPEELARIPGLDAARVSALRAAIEIGRRVVATPWPRGERFSSSRQVYLSLAPRLRDFRREVFVVVLLDGRNRKMEEVRVSEGSLSASIVHPREVFLPAVRASAAAILVVHNHPSGDPRPSPEDREVTHRLAQAGDLLGIRLLDHVIVGETSYWSFADEGALRPPGSGDGLGRGSGFCP